MKTLVTACTFAAIVLLPACASSYNNAPVETVATNSTRYGVVENVSEVHTEVGHKGPGAGALLGGVVGGVLGHQVGGGTGNTVATIAGAVGGAVVGDNVQKHSEAIKVAYQIDVRLDGGDTASFQVADNAYRVGDRVRVRDGVLSRY